MFVSDKGFLAWGSPAAVAVDIEAMRLSLARSKKEHSPCDSLYPSGGSGMGGGEEKKREKEKGPCSFHCRSSAGVASFKSEQVKFTCKTEREKSWDSLLLKGEELGNSRFLKAALIYLRGQELHQGLLHEC